MRGPGWNRLGTFEGKDLDLFFGANGTSGVTVTVQGEIDGKRGLNKAIHEK